MKLIFSKFDKPKTILLKYIVSFLHRVVSKSSSNRTSSKLLSEVFVPLLSCFPVGKTISGSGLLLKGIIEHPEWIEYKISINYLSQIIDDCLFVEDFEDYSFPVSLNSVEGLHRGHIYISNYRLVFKQRNRADGVKIPDFSLPLASISSITGKTKDKFELVIKSKDGKSIAFVFQFLQEYQKLLNIISCYNMPQSIHMLFAFTYGLFYHHYHPSSISLSNIKLNTSLPSSTSSINTSGLPSSTSSISISELKQSALPSSTSIPYSLSSLQEKSIISRKNTAQSSLGGSSQPLPSPMGTPSQSKVILESRSLSQPHTGSSSGIIRRSRDISPNHNTRLSSADLYLPINTIQLSTSPTSSTARSNQGTPGNSSQQTQMQGSSSQHHAHAHAHAHPHGLSLKNSIELFKNSLISNYYQDDIINLRETTWGEYDCIEEYFRQGLLIPIQWYSISCSLCKSYPKDIIIPKSMKDDHIHRLSKNYYEYCFPTLVYYNAISSACLLRSTLMIQNIPVNQASSIQSNANLMKSTTATSAATSNISSNNINSLNVDARNRISAAYATADIDKLMYFDSIIQLLPNQILHSFSFTSNKHDSSTSTSSSNSQYLKNQKQSSFYINQLSSPTPNVPSTQKQRANKHLSLGRNTKNSLLSNYSINSQGSSNISNSNAIHNKNKHETFTFGDSTLIYKTLCSIVHEDHTSANSRIAIHQWISSICELLTISSTISNKISSGESVLIEDNEMNHFIIMSLSMLMNDPYYCTLKVFKILIEHVWIRFGYPFAKFCGYTTLDQPVSSASDSISIF